MKMINKLEFEQVLNEHETVEVSVKTQQGQHTFLLKPKKQLLTESSVKGEFVVFDELSGTFQAFNFDDVRGVAVRY